MKISLILLTVLCLACLFSGCTQGDTDEIKAALASPDMMMAAKGEGTNRADNAFEWPSEGMAAALPQPSFDDMILSEHTDTHIEVIVIGETAENIREYVNTVRSFGYTVNEELSEGDVLGVEMCSFSAENEHGYIFNLNYTAGVCTFRVSAPAES